MANLIYAFAILIVLALPFQYCLAGEATCSVISDQYYRTFDTKRLIFMGLCQYVLVKDADDKFEVLQNNVGCGSHNAVTCANSVTATVKGIKIHVVRGGQVTVFGFTVNLPYTNKGIQIIKVGKRDVKITTDIGLTVRYDGRYNIYVTVNDRYKGETLGLCGNYNANPNDDFVKPDKTTTVNVIEFSDSWKVRNSCPNPPPLLNPCLNAGSLALQAKKKCSLLKLSPFSQCHNTVKQDSGFIQDCEYDVCACNEHALSCLCKKYSAYATTCSIAGVIVKWKHLPAFKECSSPCASGPCKNGGTCSNNGLGFKCSCTPGYVGLQCEIRSCKNPKALGMENGQILDSQITASSQWDVNHRPPNARLNFKAHGGRTWAWSSRRNDVKQWLQIDFKNPATIDEILTQGRRYTNQWVKTYTVSFSNDGVTFNPYRHRGLIKVFYANIDANTIVRQRVSPVINARYIRLHPKTWRSHISMRAEFIGCFEEWACIPNPCLNGATCLEYRDSYLCSCATGFAGRNCEKLQGPCPNTSG